MSSDLSKKKQIPRGPRFQQYFTYIDTHPHNICDLIYRNPVKHFENINFDPLYLKNYTTNLLCFCLEKNRVSVVEVTYEEKPFERHFSLRGEEWGLIACLPT